MEKDFFFTSKEIKRLFLRKKKVYIRLFFSVFFLVLVFRLVSPPLYTATAIFKQASQESTNADLVRSFLQHPSFGSKESGVQTVLESRTLLKQVMEKLGLVLEVKNRPVPLRYVQTIKDRVYAELGLCIPERDLFQFSDVTFFLDSPTDFFIRILSEKSFEVLNAKSQKIQEGVIGSSVFFGGGSFTLVKAPLFVKEQIYKVRIHPWVDVIKNIRDNLKIKSSKKDKNILTLSYSSSDAEKSASFLNSLMSSYQRYLQKENEELSSVQMEYLEKRQKELMQKYEEALEEHVAFLNSSLADTGFVSFKQEIELLEKPNEEYLGRLYDIDLRLSRLNPKKKELKDSKDEDQGYGFQKCEGEKKSFREDLSLKGPEKIFAGKEQVLRDVHLSTQKQMAGINPETAERLSLEYSNELEELDITIEQLTRLQKQILAPNFEITSLSGVLTDVVSQEMIQKAGRAALEMQDRANYSSKDLERIKQSMDVQKRFLLQHITELLGTHKVRALLLEEKIASLQKTSTDLLQVEKKLIQNQLDSLQERMKSLPEKWKRESQLLVQRDLSMGVVEGLTQLAESKNIHHQLFHVESKPIDWAYAPYKASRSFIVGQGILAGLFISLSLFLLHFTRWLLRGRAITEDSAKHLGVVFCGFLQKLFSEQLDEIGFKDKETLRKVSSFVFSCFKEKKGSCISILSESSAFLEGVGSLLNLKGLKVILVDCTPALVNTKAEAGLYEYLSGNQPIHISKEACFDRIYSGGYDGAFAEMLFKESFERLILELSSAYDVVILSKRADLSDSVAAPLKAITDAFVIHKEDVFYEDVSSVLEDSYKRKLAVVLF